MAEMFDVLTATGRHWWSGGNYNMYAVLDAARDEAILARIVLSGVPSKCLFTGEKALDLAEVAPYIVSLEQNDPFTAWVLKNGWGKSWGIFIQSEESLKFLFCHFRQFVRVYDDKLQPVYFRYYDPRVFRVYLPTCNREELETIFGPAVKFFAESEDADSLIEYSLIEGKLNQRILGNQG